MSSGTPQRARCPAPDIGIGANIYLLKWLSLRADFMYYMTVVLDDPRIRPSGTEGQTLSSGGESAIAGGNERGGTLLRNNYFLTLGISFHLPYD